MHIMEDLLKRAEEAEAAPNEPLRQAKKSALLTWLSGSLNKLREAVQALKCARYTYDAEVTRVIDGDTIDVIIDLGCHVSIHRRLRLLDVDTWEKRGDNKQKGVEAMVWLRDRLSEEHNNIIIRTHMDKEGKYGRLLATLYTRDGVNLNEEIKALWQKQR